LVGQAAGRACGLQKMGDGGGGHCLIWMEWHQFLIFDVRKLDFLSYLQMVRYRDGAGNTGEENSSVFSPIRML